MIKKCIFALVLTTLIAGQQVYASPIYGTVTMTNTGFGAIDTMRIWGGGHSGLDVYAGVYMFDKTAGTGQGQLIANGPVGAFCMDLSEYLASGTQTYNVISVQDGPAPASFLGGPMGQQKADFLAELWGRFYDPAWAAGGNYTAQQRSNAEAFSACVWEIIYEDLPTSLLGWDVTTDGTAGNKGFKAENLDYQTANSWLHALNGTGPKAQLRSLSYCGYQDMLVAVPEPATVAFLTMGFTSLVLNRKDLKFKAKS
ncbi:MAG: hypothetical protein ABSE89_10565 [Sedimentisphaerales bacterium]